MTDQNPDREKLLRAISGGLDKDEKPYSFEESRNFWAETLDDVADAILASEWMREHNERVRREAATEQREKDARIAEQSARPRPGHGSMSEGSRSAWYAYGRRDAAAAIREQGNDE